MDTAALWDPCLERSNKFKEEFWCCSSQIAKQGFRARMMDAVPTYWGAQREKDTHNPRCCGEAQAASPPSLCHPTATTTQQTKLIPFQPLENKIFPSLIREADSHYYVK